MVFKNWPARLYRNIYRLKSLIVLNTSQVGNGSEFSFFYMPMFDIKYYYLYFC